MGSWGPGLYDDDVAADLKSSLSLIAKIPVEGDRLLAILLAIRGSVPQLNEVDDISFWLVVADQFERRGILCQDVFRQALTAIESGADHAALAELGMSAQQLAKREQMLSELAARLRAPRPARALPKTPKPPDAIVQIGQIYAFPTFDGIAIRGSNLAIADADYGPNGWGALVVIAQGRAFDWLPWSAVAALAVPSERIPALQDCLQAEVMTHPQTHGAGAGSVRALNTSP